MKKNDGGIAATGESQGSFGKKNSPLFFVNGLVAYFRGGVSADASPFAAPDCLSDEFRRAGYPQPRFEESFRSFLDNFQYRDLLHTKLPRGLRSMDRESMAFGRELRVPLLDHRLVEFAFSLPVEQRIRGGQPAFLYAGSGQEAFAENNQPQPQAVASQSPARCGFRKNCGRGFGVFYLRGLLNQENISIRRKVLEEYQKYIHQKNPANAFHIWQWLSVELWFRAFIDK